MPRTRSGFKYVLTCMCYASKYPDAVPMKRADAKDQVRVLKYVLTCMCYASKYPDALPMKRADAKDQVRFKYVLTCMCYASKYPDAHPMKRPDAKAIAEAMMEIFSRTGFSEEILTDKGPSFVGELGGQVCELLKFHAIRTSPYHSQTDGMLERWHTSFKSMVQKSGVDSRNWDTYLKYLLFAYRSAPHTVTGFTPFEPIYGRDVQGPPEMLKQGWLEGSIPAKALHEWVEELRDRLISMAELVSTRKVVYQQKLYMIRDRLVSMAELVSTRESASKVKMKDTYDKKSRPRELAVGSRVLMRDT